jgi:hypothetical protein
MVAKYIKIVQDSGIVTVRGHAKDSLIFGFSKGKFDKFSGFDKDLVEMKFKSPSVKVNGTFSAKSHVINLPINTSGAYTAIFSIDIQFQFLFALFANHFI